MTLEARLEIWIVARCQEKNPRSQQIAELNAIFRGIYSDRRFWQYRNGGNRDYYEDALSLMWQYFADLSDVFLSCCETGMTMPQSFTDELLTLGTGFLCAGARSVISSLWAVSDLATAILSQIYHQYRAQGQDRIVALQKAQQDLRRMSGEQLKALSEAEFIPALMAQQEQLEECRQNARTQKKQSEAERYGQLIDRLVDTQINLEKLWTRSLPFDHPVYWAPFTCQGLR
jgi:CHAT domain-containing protein